MKHFFDIGANVGQTFDYLETLDRDFSDYKFWLFEPSPRHLAGLIKKCGDVKYDVTICPFGVGGTTRTMPLYEKDDCMGDSFHSWHKSDHVPVNRFDAYKVHGSIVAISHVILDITSFGDEIILDIDAEGSEFEILSCLTEWRQLVPRVKEIWVEWHRINPTPNLTPDEFSKWCEMNSIAVTHRGLQNLE